MLVERRGAAVSREELYDRLWPDGAVEDANLTQTVFLLRRALHPDGDGRRYVETLPRFGYRFACEVIVPTGRAQPSRWSLAVRAATVLLTASVLSSGASSQNARPLAAEASAAYALGRFHVDMRGRGNLLRSVEYFQRAVRAEPSRGQGYAGLASAHALLAEFEPERSPRFDAEVALAKRMQANAVRRDPSNADAHAVAGFIAYRFDGNFAAADREFRAAFAADDSNAMAHHWYAGSLLARGRLDAAVAGWETANRMDPTSEVYLRWLARGYAYQRRYRDAARRFAETLAIRPTDGAAGIGLAIAYEELGRFHDARAELREITRLVPYEWRYAVPAAARIALRADPARRDRAVDERLARLVDAGRIDGTETAAYFLAAHDRERALLALRHVRGSSELARAIVRLDPRFSALRSDARFRALVAGRAP
jgi:tetratricopeptide (TPR) repeat protein